MTPADARRILEAATEVSVNENPIAAQNQALMFIEAMVTLGYMDEIVDEQGETKVQLNQAGERYLGITL